MLYPRSRARGVCVCVCVCVCVHRTQVLHGGVLCANVHLSSLTCGGGGGRCVLASLQPTRTRVRARSHINIHKGTHLHTGTPTHKHTQAGEGFCKASPIFLLKRNNTENLNIWHLTKELDAQEQNVTREPVLLMRRNPVYKYRRLEFS